VIAHIVQIPVERGGQRGALRRWFGFGGRRDDAIALCCEFGLFDTGFVGGVLGITARRVTVALALIPPLDEITTFGVVLILAVDSDMIAANPAFAIEKGAGMSPLVVDFDLFEKRYARKSRHMAVLWRTANRIANK